MAWMTIWPYSKQLANRTSTSSSKECLLLVHVPCSQTRVPQPSECFECRQHRCCKGGLAAAHADSTGSRRPAALRGERCGIAGSNVCLKRFGSRLLLFLNRGVDIYRYLARYSIGNYRVRMVMDRPTDQPCG